MSVGQAQKQRETTHKPESPGGLTKLLALTGQDMSLRARGALIWGLALGGLGALYVALYPSFAGDEGIEQMIESMPQAMKDLAGFGESTGFESVEAFLATEMLNFIVPLALSVFPILIASSALAGAEEEGTMDVLLGNPLPRWQLVASRFLSAAVLLLGILTLMGFLTWIAAPIFDVDLSIDSAAAGALNLWPLCLFFGGVAMLCSAIFHRRLLAIAIPVTLLVAMYFVDGLANSVEFLEDIQPLSAFYYYGSAIQDGMDWANFAGLTAATLVLVGLAILIFRWRDIYT